MQGWCSFRRVSGLVSKLLLAVPRFPAKRRMKKNTWPPIRQEDGSELSAIRAHSEEVGTQFRVYFAEFAKRKGTCVFAVFQDCH